MWVDDDLKGSQAVPVGGSVLSVSVSVNREPQCLL